MEGVKLTVDESISAICSICHNNNLIFKVMKKEQVINIEIKDEQEKGMLHIYPSRKGLRITKSIHHNESINNKVYDEFKTKYEGNTVILANFRYDLNPGDSKINNIKSEIWAYIEEHKYTLQENKNNVNIEVYNYTIEGEHKQKVNITQYKNGTLFIKGLRWTLWEDICYIVENKLNSSITDIMKRLSGKENTDSEEYSNIDDKSEQYLRNYLGEDTYCFLYDYDMNIIISAQNLISEKTNMRDYGFIMQPVYRALEGYFKKLLIEANIVLESEIRRKKPRFEFTNIFEINRTLKSDYENKLIDNYKAEKLRFLSALCEKMWNFRNKTSHSGPDKPLIINTFSQCETYFNDVLELIKNSYKFLIEVDKN